MMCGMVIDIQYVVHIPSTLADATTCLRLPSRLQSIAAVHTLVFISIPLRIGGWVCLNGWLHTETFYLQMVTHLSTNRA